MTCALCGHVFDPQEHASCPACPLQSACSSVCCPQCGYQTVNEDKSALLNLIGKLRAKTTKINSGNGLTDEKT
ncbi:MAG: hypothetical protein IBX69_02570 [Anaerolineales bacterium]|nr:hypothetical protein [Anaerolineales bacterium]